MITQNEETKPVERIVDARTKTMEELKAEREAKKLKVLEYLERFPFYKWAAAYAGIDVTTLENWRKEDGEFSAHCEANKAEAIERLGRRATPDFMLKNVDPETFKDKKEMEVSGDPLIIVTDASKSK